MNNTTETEAQTRVVKDLKEKKILISREFRAPLPEVWRAFTEKEILDKWWAPAPWRAETKVMNFEVGGYWLYAMVSPENEKHWGKMTYKAIDRHQSFDMEDAFCDENGVPNATLPVSRGRNLFTETATGTKVEMMTTYPTEADVQKIIEMGFEQGINACFEQLAELLAQ